MRVEKGVRPLKKFIIGSTQPHRKGGLRDHWLVFRYQMPSREGWVVIRAIQKLDDFNGKLAGPSSRRCNRPVIQVRIAEIPSEHKVTRQLGDELVRDQ